MRDLRIWPLAVAAAASIAAAQERPADPAAERRLELRAADVGRLALRNGPAYRVRELDPAIARTRVREALGAFDTLFTAHGGFGGSRSEVFFDPSLAGDPAVTSSRAPTFRESHLRAGAGLSSAEEWGGSWRVGYEAESQDRRGATSIESLSPRYAGDLSGSYRHPLLRGAGREVTLALTREAERLADEADLALVRDAELTVERAEDAYWDLVAAAADRELKRKSVDVARELHAVVKARVESGRGIPVDLSEAVAGIARREVDLIAADNEVENAADRLRELVLPFDPSDPDLELTLVAADEPGREPAPPSAPAGPEDVAAAIARRADVRAAEKRADAARIAELRAEDDLAASLEAVFGAGLRGRGSGFAESSEKIGRRREYRWDAGLELEVPLGNLAAEARAERARRLRERAERESWALRSVVVREVREAARNLRSAVDRIGAARRATEAAREQLDAVRSRLDSGRATPFDVLQAEEELTRSAATEVSARVDYEKARTAVLRAGGTLLDARGLATEPRQ